MELKTVVIGEASVGKTSISTRFCHGALPQVASPTIGASYIQKRCEVNQTSVILQLWDTAGQERFRALAPLYYRAANIAIIVASSEMPFDLEDLEKWRRNVLSYAAPNVCIAFALNKSDLPLHEDLSLDAVNQACASLHLPFFTTSAVTGEGIDDLFHRCIEIAIATRQELENDEGVESAIEHGGAIPHVITHNRKKINGGRRGNCC